MSRIAQNLFRGCRSVGLSRTRPAATRCFSLSTSFREQIVSEKQVPVTVWDGDQATGDKYTVRVPDEAARSPLENPVEDCESRPVNPLSQEVYDRMPYTMRSMSVYGKTIIVTGGARGLGNHMARACAEAGAKNIVIFDANQELGEESAAELHAQTGLPISFYKVDVRDSAAIIAAVDSCVEKYGAPDVLINSAGIADSNIKAETYDPAMFRRLIDINLTGSFLVSQAVGRAMMAARKPGSIVLIASMSGSIVNYPQEQSCYNASKAGVIQLGKSLAAEWAKYNIRVNCISPGYMDTALNRVPALEAQKKVWKSLTPQNRLGGVDELNGLCVFLASDASKFMSGANCAIDGGYTCY
ncbi:hypothetical protein jhhlp_000668 [Lomentospora prolificans]|uniref:Uncharacterized protein n=1 Tax=Lomentospora prolificans TaxID=41688 RepID=A0A2N3NJD6_9PEZI|nr:hypothetical protein jhhlp_000668 [Lomentospora prolificans]